MALTIPLNCLTLERIPKFISIILLKWKLNLEKILFISSEFLPSGTFPHGLGLGFKMVARSWDELSAFGL